MTCREIADFLSDYMNGELSELQRKAFDMHLGVCPDCVAYLQSYELTVKLSKSTGAHENRRQNEDISEDLILAILAVRNRFG